MFRSIRLRTQPDPTDADSMLAAVQAGNRVVGRSPLEVRAPDELSAGRSCSATPTGPRELEPAQPMSARLRRSRRSASRLEMPSWLLSLVTHLMLLVVIGALAWTPRGPHDLTPIFLTLSLTEGEDDTNSSPLVVAAIPGQREPEQAQKADTQKVDTDASPTAQHQQSADTAPAQAGREPNAILPAPHVRQPCASPSSCGTRWPRASCGDCRPCGTRRALPSGRPTAEGFPARRTRSWIGSSSTTWGACRGTRACKLGRTFNSWVPRRFPPWFAG